MKMIVTYTFLRIFESYGLMIYYKGTELVIDKIKLRRSRTSVFKL